MFSVLNLMSGSVKILKMSKVFEWSVFWLFIDFILVQANDGLVASKVNTIKTWVDGQEPSCFGLLIEDYSGIFKGTRYIKMKGGATCY